MGYNLFIDAVLAGVAMMQDVVVVIGKSKGRVGKIHGELANQNPFVSRVWVTFYDGTTQCRALHTLRPAFAHEIEFARIDVLNPKRLRRKRQ